MHRGIALLPLVFALPVLAQQDPGARGPTPFDTLRVTVPLEQGTTWFDLHLPRVAGPRPTVVICHGWAAGSTKFRATAEHLASRGMVVASFQQPDPNGNSLPRWSRQLRVGLNGLLRANADPTSALFRRIDPARLALLGHSYGAAACVAVASEDPTVRAVVAWAPVNQPHKRLLMERAAQVRAPLLVITGQLDPLARTNCYARPVYLRATAAPRREFLEVTWAGHDFYVGTGKKPLLARRHSTAWIERAFGLRGADEWTDGSAAAREKKAWLLCKQERASAGFAGVLD